MYSPTVLAIEEYRKRLKERESRVAHYGNFTFGSETFALRWHW
jgi:hypothetical protein